MMKTLILTIFGLSFLVVVFGVVSFAQTLSRKPISGGFIDYQDWMLKKQRNSDNPDALSAADWKNELDALRVAGMDTIILKHLAEDGGYFFPVQKDEVWVVDATEEILKYADENHLKVFIGLWNGNDGSGTWKNKQVRKADSRMLAEAKEKSLFVAEAAWRKYGKHKSFYGWYISPEIWNIDWTEKQNRRMRTFFRNISDYCKSLDSNQKPVAISPFFDPIYDTNNNLESVYTAFLKGDEKSKGAGIDIFMLQDSVGANSLEGKEKIATTVLPYFQTFYNAVKAANAARKSNEAKIEFWANVETFRLVNNGMIPTDFGRLSFQLENALKKSSDGQPFFGKIVTYDFFHCLSPVHKRENFDMRRKLYSDYVSNFVSAR